MSDQYPLASDTALDDVSRRGLAIYDRLKAELEPEHNNRYVAIHVDTEDYALARSSGEATRDLLKRHPIDGRIMVRRIGPEPEYGLAARLFAGEMAAGYTK